MSNKGLVVPDNPTPENWKYVPLYVPDDPQWLGIITGLLFSPCNGYWWKKNSGDWQSARDTMCQIGAYFVQNNFCDEVADCIRDNEGIREIIREIIREELAGGKDTVFGEGNPVFDSCNPDILFGATTSVVDYIDATVRDAFQILEIATNPLEAINLWADNLPIVGSLASALIEAIDWILNNIAENYDANFTIQLRDTYRCDLFCIWRDSADCNLTLADVTQYYADRIGSPDPFLALNDTLQFLFTGVWSGSQIVDTMYLLVCASLSATDAIGFFQISSAYSFNTAVALGANSPDPDWSILCDCPLPQFCYTWLGGDGFVPAWTLNTFLSTVATYDAVNDRIVGGKSPTPNTGAVADISIAFAQKPIESVSVDIQWLATRTTTTDGIYWFVNGSQVQFNGIGNSGTQTVTYSPTNPINATSIKIQAVSGGNTQGDSAFMWINKITINGQDTNPFGNDNC